MDPANTPIIIEKLKELQTEFNASADKRARHCSIRAEFQHSWEMEQIFRSLAKKVELVMDQLQTGFPTYTEATWDLRSSPTGLAHCLNEIKNVKAELMLDIRDPTFFRGTSGAQLTRNKESVKKLDAVLDLMELGPTRSSPGPR